MSIVSWFRTHKRQIITHTSIIVGLVLFTIFATEPLFDRLERIPGEAQLHRVRLPAATDDIRYSIEDVSDGGTAVQVSGWAFINGHDSMDSKTYIVLRSTKRTYVFDAAMRERPDVTKYFRELNLNLDCSGFIAIIPARKIAGGKYAIGIYITKGDIEVLQYTDKIVEF